MLNNILVHFFNIYYKITLNRQYRFRKSLIIRSLKPVYYFLDWKIIRQVPKDSKNIQVRLNVNNNPKRDIDFPDQLFELISQLILVFTKKRPVRIKALLSRLTLE